MNFLLKSKPFKSKCTWFVLYAKSTHTGFFVGQKGNTVFESINFSSRLNLSVRLTLNRHILLMNFPSFDEKPI